MKKVEKLDLESPKEQEEKLLFGSQLLNRKPNAALWSDF